MERKEPILLVKRYIEFAVLIALVVTYGVVAYERNFVWKDEVTFWSDVIKKSPDKARPYNNLGRAYLTNKAFTQAIPFLKEALRLNPYFSYAHYNIGIAYQGIGLCDEAITEYKKALYGTKQQYFAEVHNNMGVCYFAEGRTDMAINEFKRALSINPDFADAVSNLDVAFRAKSR